MAREDKDYREQMEWLSTNYPGLGLFNQKEAAKVLGCTPRTAKAKYGIDSAGIGVVALCKLLCKANKNAAQCWRTGRR